VQITGSPAGWSTSDPRAPRQSRAAPLHAWFVSINATGRGSAFLDEMPRILERFRLRDHFFPGYVRAFSVDRLELLDLWKGDDPNAGRRHAGVVDLPLKAHEGNEMPLWVLRDEVVCRPIVFLRDTFDLYGHSVARIARDDDVDAFLVSKRQVGREATPVKARENIELGGEIRIVS
jgi:hypothetical protein